MTPCLLLRTGFGFSTTVQNNVKVLEALCSQLVKSDPPEITGQYIFLCGPVELYLYPFLRYTCDQLMRQTMEQSKS